MNLTNAFRNVWKEVENAFKSQHVENLDLLAFVICKAFDKEVEGEPAIYYRGENSNANFKANFFAWRVNESPCVIFIGKLRFRPEDSSTIQRDIRTLAKYTHKSPIKVLAPSSNGEGSIEQTMKVSPDVEIGYFVISDFDDNTIRHVVDCCDLTTKEKAKLHVAFGTEINEKTERARFQYRPPIKD